MEQPRAIVHGGLEVEGISINLTAKKTYGQENQNEYFVNYEITTKKEEEDLFYLDKGKIVVRKGEFFDAARKIVKNIKQIFTAKARVFVVAELANKLEELVDDCETEYYAKLQEYRENAGGWR